MSGYLPLKWPMIAGSTYSPGMVLAPTSSSPLMRPLKPSMAWRASRERVSIRWAYERSSWPARVTEAPRPSRSRRRTPSSSSSVLMCSDTVG